MNRGRKHGPTRVRQLVGPSFQVEEDGAENSAMSPLIANSENSNVNLIREFKSLVSPTF